ncbi:hypothetical protein MHX64_11230, partial [Corynebacterium sp. ACRPZ]|nr:hypothetical protein [Corynebacterium sp. ACRPZ]
MAMYEVPSGPRRLPVERLPIDVPSATLTPELDVVVDGETVGSVEDAELAQLASSGVTPVVAVDGGAVVLPPAGQVLPVNTPPREPWALLPAGERYVADLTGKLPVEAPAQVLVSMGFDDAGEIVLCVDGDIIGELDPAAGEALTPTLRRLEDRGLIAVARGYTTAVEAGTSLAVIAGPIPTDDIPISPLPPIVREVEVAHPGTNFFATMDAEAAALAADTEERPAESVREPGKSRGPLIAAAAAVAALVLAGVGTVVMSSPSGLERDSTSAYQKTSEVSQPSSSAEPSTEPSTEPTEESTEPSPSQFSTELPENAPEPVVEVQQPAPAPQE